MSFLRLASVVFMFSLFCHRTAALVDGSQTEVSAEQRLRDYLAESKYPPENRRLLADEPPLEKVPLVPGDAAQSAVILGFVKERLSQGSLIVEFRVKVTEGGLFSFRTFLLSAAGAPLVQALVTRDLPTGDQILQFQFYGKAIRDAGQSGSFLLPGITGEKLPDARGRAGSLRYFQGPFRTRAYRLLDFTDRAWDSPAKRARVLELQKEIRSERKKSP